MRLRFDVNLERFTIREIRSRRRKEENKSMGTWGKGITCRAGFEAIREGAGRNLASPEVTLL